VRLAIVAPATGETIMRLRYSGLDIGQFQPLFGLDDAALAVRGIERVTCTESPATPAA